MIDDPDEIEEQRELDQERAREDLRELLRNSQFRDYVLRLTQLCGIFSHSYVASAEVHYQAGRKSVGMAVFNEIRNADPKVAADLVIRMTKTDD